MYGLARRQIFSDAEAKRTGQNFEFHWHGIGILIRILLASTNNAHISITLTIYRRRPRAERMNRIESMATN